MTRAAVPGLPSRYPIGTLLPGMYAGDEFAQRFTAGLDELVAPVLSTLDNLPAYFDTRLAPADFLPWLASWLGIDVDPAWEGEARQVVARAVALHRWRGTRRGLAERLWLCLGARAQIVDGGGASWSATAGGALPGTESGEVLVRVWPERTPELDRARVVAVVQAACPVHLTTRVEILAGPPDDGGS